MRAQKQARCFDSGDGSANAERISCSAYGGTKPVDRKHVLVSGLYVS